MVFGSVIKNEIHNDEINEDKGASYKNKGLNFWFVTGFVDGEGSFSLRLRLRGGCTCVF